MSIYKHKAVGGTLLVAGTAIGAGMLALPITTGVAGFWPSIALLAVVFVYMLWALFLLLEANLYCHELEANIITMARDRLGGIGQILAWFSFLLLMYSAAAAYSSAGGALIAKLLSGVTKFDITATNGVWLFAILFGLIVYFGTWLIDHINRVLMIGLIGSYFVLAFFVTPHIEVKNLTVVQPIYLLSAVPIVLLSFTSHIILPSLRTYLNNDIAQLKKIMWIGSSVPLIFYVVWQLVVTGVVPLKELAEISQGGHPVAHLTDVLQADLHLNWIAVAVGAFSFFALVTSFLGVVLSLSDFLADGFQVKRTRAGRAILVVMTIVPPLAFALLFPRGFVIALGYAGVFVAVLYGVLPPWMVWKARYIEKLDAKFKVPGGKPALVLTFLIGCAVIVFQIAATLGYLPTPS